MTLSESSSPSEALRLSNTAHVTATASPQPTASSSASTPPVAALFPAIAVVLSATGPTNVTSISPGSSVTLIATVTVNGQRVVPSTASITLTWTVVLSTASLADGSSDGPIWSTTDIAATVFQDTPSDQNAFIAANTLQPASRSRVQVTARLIASSTIVTASSTLDLVTTSVPVGGSIVTSVTTGVAGLTRYVPGHRRENHTALTKPEPP